MASIPPESKPHGATWDSFPSEIKILILEDLMQDGCSLAHLATVSREWQGYIERHNFARIRLTPPRLANLRAMTQRNCDLVGYIWFCLELDRYDCNTCAPSEAYNELTEEEAVEKEQEGHMVEAWHKAFSVMDHTWSARGNLTLDISIYSPSDLEHWFKYLTFRPDGDPEKVMVKSGYHDPAHGWVAGSRSRPPPQDAAMAIFSRIMDRSWCSDLPDKLEDEQHQRWLQFPLVPVVCGLLLRQQNRQKWKPITLKDMLSRFPRLNEFHYEPWGQDYDDHSSLSKFIHPPNYNLKKIVLFENINENYPLGLESMIREEDEPSEPWPAFTQTVTCASLKLEHLAASFLQDASNFFEIQPVHDWPNLTTLVLTSKILAPGVRPARTGAMLETAAVTAMKMPRLKTLEIWNGRKGLAALFQYRVLPNTPEAAITWRATWELTMEPSTVQSWEAVAQKQGGLRLSWTQDRLDEDMIKCVGDAIHYLMLSSEDIRPVSLWQIRNEQRALEGGHSE